MRAWRRESWFLLAIFKKKEGWKAKPVPKRLLTPNAEQALRLASEEATRSSSAQILPHHVLLAMIRLFHSTASRVLQGGGIGLDALHDTLIEAPIRDRDPSSDHA